MHLEIKKKKNTRERERERETKSETLSVSLLETNDVSSIGFNSTATIAVPPDRIKYLCRFRPFLSLTHSLTHSLSVCGSAYRTLFLYGPLESLGAPIKLDEIAFRRRPRKRRVPLAVRSLPRYEIKYQCAACRVQPVSEGGFSPTGQPATHHATTKPEN